LQESTTLDTVLIAKLDNRRLSVLSMIVSISTPEISPDEVSNNQIDEKEQWKNTSMRSIGHRTEKRKEIYDRL
jgi:hypothetical protein